MRGIQRQIALIGLITVSAMVGRAGEESSRDEIAGTWSGTSPCIAKDTACHDETVVYHIAAIPSASNRFSVSADKIADGRPVNMGTLEFNYDPAEHTLSCTYAQGIWRLKVEAGKIEGMLTRRDGTIFRRLSLKKSA